MEEFLLNEMKNEIEKRLYLKHTITNWDKKFILLCDHIASWSKDRSTKVGAVIVNDYNRVLSLGYNGFPSGFDDEIEERHERPLKYDFTEHAERNAIYNAANIGVSLRGAKIYLSWFPCKDCARAIIQSGIKEVIVKEFDKNCERWGSNFSFSHSLLKEADVKIKFYK